MRNVSVECNANMNAWFIKRQKKRCIVENVKWDGIWRSLPSDSSTFK